MFASWCVYFYFSVSPQRWSGTAGRSKRLDCSAYVSGTPEEGIIYTRYTVFVGQGVLVELYTTQNCNDVSFILSRYVRNVSMKYEYADGIDISGKSGSVCRRSPIFVSGVLFKGRVDVCIVRKKKKKRR